MATWTVEVKYTSAGSWNDITTLVMTDSISRDWRMYNNLKATTNTLSFKMHRNAGVIASLLSSDQPEIRVHRDAADYFTGDIRKTFRIRSAHNVGPVDVECVDYSERLSKKKMDWTAALANYKVCDPGNTSASLVHYFLTQEGSGITLDVPTINKTIPLYVNVGGVSDRTYWQALEDVLFPFGYVFDFNPTGELILHDFLPSSTSTVDEFNRSSIRSELQLRRSNVDYDGVEVKWWEQATDTSATVFKDTTGGDATNEMSVPLDAGDVYPGDDTRPFYAEYQYDKGDIVNVANASLSIEHTGNIVQTEFTNFFTRALVQVENTSGSQRTLRKFRILGDVTYRNELNIVRSEDWSTSLKRLSIDSAYIADQADARKLSTGLKRYYSNASFTYSLRSEDEYDPGAFIDVKDSNIGVDQTCVIVRQKVASERTDTPLFEYELDALEPFVSETNVEESFHNPGNDLTEQIDNLPSTTTILDLIDDGYTNTGSATNAGTTVPEAPMVTAKSAQKSIVLEWDIQTNLTNFARYEVQISTDDATWYDLDFAGAGTGSTLNGDTDWYSTILVHLRLPLAGTDDDPTPSTWYYRVRRVTRASSESAWSTSVSAQALAVGNGDLAADSIYSNNLRTGVVVADKILAGAVGPTKLSADALAFPTEGLVAYYSFDDGSAIDTSGNGNNGTITGATAVDGKSRKALSFNGSNRVNTTLPFPTSGPFSVSLWAKIPDHTVLTHRNTVISDNGTRPELCAVYGPSVTKQPLIYIGLSNYRYFDGRYDDDQWHHYVFIVQGYGQYDIDDSALYVDGVALAPATTLNSGTPTSVVGNTRIGNFTLGLIDEVRIYNRALSAAEVASLYRFPGGVEPGVVDGLWLSDASIIADKIAAGAITTGKLATDSIKSINFNAGVAGSFLDLTTGEMEMYDGSSGIVRSLIIGPNGGLKASDEDAVIIHDLPEGNIGADNYYCGHLIWFENAAQYELLNTNSPAAFFTSVVCEDSGITNARGGVFRIRSSRKAGTGTTQASTWIMLRPKGSGWSGTVGANTPIEYYSVSGLPSGTPTMLFYTTMLCPIGDDFSIDYQCSASSVTIWQIGVFV